MTAIDTGSDDLLAEIDEGVAMITMNRPSRRNAFSNEMVQALGRVLVEVEVSDEVGCVVLTGAGGAFSAGGDVKAMAEGGASGVKGIRPLAEPPTANSPQRTTTDGSAGSMATAMLGLPSVTAPPPKCTAKPLLTEA